MAQGNYEVEVTQVANKNIQNIYDYIEENGYPLTGEKFIQRLYLSISELDTFPEFNSMCKSKTFARYKWRCAIFENTYIIAHKIFNSKIFVMRDIHGNRLK